MPGGIDGDDGDSDLLLQLAQGGFTVPIKSEFGLAKKRKFEELEPLDVDEYHLAAKEPSKQPNLVPISAYVETHAALIVLLLRHPLVDCSVANVTEKSVEMSCVPNINVVRFLKEVAINEEEIEEIIFAVNSRPNFVPVTLKFEISDGCLDKNQNSWAIEKDVGKGRDKNQQVITRTVLRIPKVTTTGPLVL